MKKLHLISICCLMAWLTNSCEDDVIIKNGGIESSKLVLYCRLVPAQDTIYLSLSHSIALFGGRNHSFQSITNAVVELSNDNVNWARMNYDVGKKRYILLQSQFPITEGATYYVRASASGFEPVSSSCTVPYWRETNLRFVGRFANHDVHYGEVYNFEHIDFYWSWDDYAGENNYYMFMTENYYWTVRYSTFGEGMDSIFAHSYGAIYDEKGITCFSDKDKDGSTMSLLRHISYKDYRSDWSQDTNFIYMLQLDRNCYLYETTLADYDFLSSMSLEPSLTYNNIKNGYGLFGAYTMRDVSAILQ